MEFSLVFIGNRNRKQILEEISKINLIYTSYKVFFLTNKKLKTENLSNININFSTITFDSSTTNEEMLETFIQKSENKSVLFVKESGQNINAKDINKMIEQNKKGNMLVVSRQSKKSNILKTIFKPIKDFFIRIFLGVRLFDGEADIILLDKTLISIMKEMPGRSAMLTKINGWIGVEPKYIEITEQPKQKQNYTIKDSWQVILTFSILLLFIITDIILGALKTSIPFIWLFLFIVIQIAVLGLGLYYLTKTIFNIKYGTMKYIPQSRILDETDNFNQ